MMTVSLVAEASEIAPAHRRFHDKKYLLPCYNDILSAEQLVLLVSASVQIR